MLFATLSLGDRSLYFMCSCYTEAMERAEREWYDRTRRLPTMWDIGFRKLLALATLRSAIPATSELLHWLGQQKFKTITTTFIAAHLHSVDDGNLLVAEAAQHADMCCCQWMQPHLLVHCWCKQQRPIQVPRSYYTSLQQHRNTQVLLNCRCCNTGQSLD